MRRHYQDGETIKYVMDGYNATGDTPKTYTVDATGSVNADANGIFTEAFQWQDLVVNSAPVALTAASLSFRELLSLDPKFDLKKPDGTLFQSELAGPVYDLMTFYADIRVASNSGRLNRVGDHYNFAHGQPNSWADSYVGFVIAEDCIDFDLTLQDIDEAAGEATLFVKHVPPTHQCVNLPAPWMQEPVSDRPNNWVQVIRIPNGGGFLVEVGREEFDDTIKIELGTGKMKMAEMTNPLHTVERFCTDEALSNCGPPTIHSNKIRKIKVAAVVKRPN